MNTAGEFLELVWENGQILTRGRSASLSCISFFSQDTKSVTEGDIYPQKRQRFGITDSVFGLSGGEKFAIKGSLLQDDHTEFSRVMETSQNNANDECIEDPWIVPVCQGESFWPEDASLREIPQITKARTDTRQEQSSLPQCHVSALFSRSIMNGSQNMSMGELRNSNSQQVKSSEPDNHLGLRPGIVHSGDQSQGATWSAGLPSSARGQVSKEKTVTAIVEPVTSLENDKQSCEYLDLVATEENQTKRIASSPKEALPDEHSEAPVHGNDNKNKRIPGPTSSLEKANIVKRKPDAQKSVDQLATATSTSSRGASNDPTLKRRHDHTDQEMASPSENADEEEHTLKPAPVRASAKKRRTPEVHNQSERKRRDKINKKMRTLQALIPNSSKVDKASLLDMAIDYLKTLQLQHQIMSMGRSLCMPPMMIPTAMQQIQASQLAHYSSMMSMRMGMNPSPFSNPAIMGLAAAAQMLPTVAPITTHPPFVPLVRGSCSPSPGELTGSGDTLFSFK